MCYTDCWLCFIFPSISHRRRQYVSRLLWWCRPCRGLGHVWPRPWRADLFLLMWQGGASIKPSRISRREISMRETGSVGRSRGGPFAPSGVLGLYPRTSTIREGPSLMAGLVGWTFVNVSSWLACVTGDWRYLRTLSSTAIHETIDRRGWVINSCFCNYILCFVSVPRYLNTEYHIIRTMRHTA